MADGFDGEIPEETPEEQEARRRADEERERRSRALEEGQRSRRPGK